MKGILKSLLSLGSRSASSHGSFAEEQNQQRRQEQLVRIDFDMMLKGSIYKRRKEDIRQYGVTVNGSTRLVTSGDLVDLETYRALLAAGAVRPIPAVHPEVISVTPSFVDFTTIEGHED